MPDSIGHRQMDNRLEERVCTYDVLFLLLKERLMLDIYQLRLGLHPVAVLKYNICTQIHVHNKKNTEQ
jgi:hypothetical protein